MNKLFMNTPTTRTTLAAAFAAAAIGATLPASASDFTVTSTTNRFIVTRTGEGINSAETVRYRTVSQSAYAGQHFTEKSGTLSFAAGQTAVTNFVTETTPTADAYKFQTGSQRTYRFELTDEGGFPITNKVRNITIGTSVPSSGAFNVKDVTIQSAEYTADDRGYAENGYKSVASSNYFNNAAPREYYSLIGAQLRMTLSMQAKENDDAYEYLQLLFGNTSSCDNRSGASNGDPGTPSLSSYMAGFEMDTDSTDSTYRNYAFPVTNVANNAGDTNPWGYSTNGKYPLYKQKFNTSTSGRATDGRIVVPLNFSSIVLRLNASGSSGSDEWAAKNVKAHIQAVDFTQPTLYGGNVNAISVSPGPHCKGNEFYISIPFNEIVSSAGSKILRTTWGSMDYHSGDGSNVITFKGTVNAAANTTLAITNCPCTFKDLANNYFQGSPTKTFSGATVSASHAYPITYDLGGGTLSANSPTSYTYDAAALLVQPTRTGYAFAGWTGSNGSTKQKSVTINPGSHGPRSYVAHWTPITYTITYDLAGGALLDGESNPETYAVTNAAFTLANPVRTGYAFAGWTGTDLDGPTNEVTVATGSTGNRSYAATWTANTYSVRFNDNDGSSEPRYQEFSYDQPQSLDPAIARTGYDFSGWCTNEDVTVIFANCAVVSNLTTEADGVVDLYAQWVGHSYSICFDGNAADAVGNTDEMGMTYDVPDNLTSNGFTRTGYDFAGWSTSANGAVVYADGVSVSNLTAENHGSVTLYAQWTAHTYSVRFDANGGEGEMSDQLFTYDVATNLEANAFSRIGYDFAGWNTSENGAVVYADGASVSNLTAENHGSLTLYAQWTAHTYTVRFDANGGEGEMPDQTLTYDAPQALSSNAFTRAGFTFIGWSVGGEPFADGATVSNLASEQGAVVSLVAQWGVPYIDADGAEQLCANYTVITNSAGDVEYGGRAENWYFVCGDVTIDGNLCFLDTYAHLILADGATLAVTNASGNAIKAYNLAIYCQENGTGSVTANGSAYDGIHADGSVTIGGGNVIATGNDRGIYAYRNITLGWANPGDSITASSYSTYNGTVTVKAGQILTDGTAIYQRAVDPAVIAGKTLRPYFSPAPYVDANGDELECTNYIFVTSAVGDVSYGENGATNWYVVTTNVTIGGNLCFADGSAHLILCDGATLAVTNASGYAIGGQHDITIYGQANGTGVIAANGNNGHGGISVGNSFTINGGSIEVTADGSGIGGLSFTINGGSITATGGDRGISCTYNTINGGNVIASGRSSGIGGASIIITGGSIAASATGNSGDGIAGANLTIDDGILTATGSKDGINVGVVTINGGNVTATATGNDGYGIYGGNISIGWANPADSITASSYSFPSIIVKAGQSFTDGTTAYSGTLNLSSDETLSAALAGKTLRPAFAIAYDLAGGSVATDNPTFYSIESAGITLNNPTRAGYDFTGWTGTDLDVPTQTVAIAHGSTGDRHYIATWSEPILAYFWGEGNDGSSEHPYLISTTEGLDLLAELVDENSGKHFVLGWTDSTDSISVGNYGDNHFSAVNISVNPGLYLTDGTNVYSGEVTGDQISALAGKTLLPAIPYIDADGDMQYCSNFTVLTNAVDDVAYGEPNVTNWYVVVGNVAIDGGLSFDGYAHMILADGATLAVTNTNGTAIGGPDVTIYGQADGTGVIAANGNCGINAGYVTINGVNITSTGGSISGIGASTVIINGGNVTVNSDKASGISCGYFTINGGNVTASGNDSAISAFSATINGGGVTATGGSGITGHDLIINDGIVTMTGSNDGIGVANVTISGGTVTATGINGYGISGGVITLGWTDATDSITASSYDVRSIIVNDGQFLTDGTAVYSGTLNLSMDETLSAALAGKTFRPAVSYIDADGETQYCTNFTVVASAGSHAVYGEPDTTNWFVVVGNAAINGTLYFIGDAHLILADGATLAVTNTSGTAINANCNLAIYGQAGGTGVVVANGIGYGIYANQSFAINGGTVNATATDGHGICSCGNIILGWTNLGDSIFASSYNGTVSVKDGQLFTDGTDFYQGEVDPDAIACAMLRPYISRWQRLQEQLDAGGTVILTNDVTAIAVDATLVVTNSVALDLNGHTIDAASLFGAIRVAAGGHLTLTNSLAAGAITDGNSDEFGGGVYVDEDGAFTMTGGAISGNTADEEGGGVYVAEGGVFTMAGGAISGNDARDGGGVYVAEYGVFTMSAGEISGNTVFDYGSGVYVDRRGEFTMAGGAISGNDARDGGGVYVAEYGVFTMSAGEISGNTVFDYGSGVYVDRRGEFTMAGGAISGNTSDEDGGGVYLSAGTFTMTDGEIIGNTADDDGGGVYLNGGTFTMDGGEISANTASDGGGVYVNPGGEFTINGGLISDNSSIWAGGVEVQGELTMTGGAISGNAADSGGGGVYVGERGEFTMSGGEISGNSAAGDGGGVYMYYCNVSVLGSPVVFGNTNSVGAASNLYMDSWREIAVRGLLAGAYIGVTTKTAPTESSPVTFATGAAEGDETYFTSDNPGFAVYGEDGSLRLRLVVTYTVRFDANGGAGAMPDQTFIYDAQQALASNAFTRTGYTFAGWRGGDGSIYPDGATVSNLTVRHASLPADAWKLFDRMPYPGKSNDDYTPSFGDLQNKDGDNGLNLYTGFENVAWNPEDPDTVAILSANASWFDEHDARNGVSMKLIEDFPNFYFPGFYIEQVDDAQGAAVTLTAIWQPHVPVPYIDADGNEQRCTIYNVLTNANGDVAYGELGAENWYVVTNDVTISGRLFFGDYHAHLIVCDGATLTVSNGNGNAIDAYGLAIHCQTNATGALVANGSDSGIDGDSVTINGGSVTATGVNGICAYSVTINGGNVNATGGTYGIYPLYDLTINGGNVNATGGCGIWAKNITLGWTNPTDSIYASSYFGRVRVKSGKLLTDGYGGIYEGDIQDNDDIAGKTLWPGFKDPEGRIIVDFAVIDWLSENGFTQADIDALGKDSAATDKLYECWVLNCDLSAGNPGGALSITGFAVSTNHVSMTVQLVRKAPLAGCINGYLYIYGANDLAAGFDRDPIPDESVEYFTGDPYFNLVTASNDTVTQTAVATLNSSVTAKFFKAEIGIFTPYEPEDPWEPEPEDPEPEEPKE